MTNKISTDPRAPARPRRAAGFTLIELVIAMVIAAILAAIAIPAYSNYVRKSRRTEAKTALLDLASLEERYFSTQNIYSATATDLGYTAWPTTTASGYYTIAAPTIVPAVAPTSLAPAGSPATYSFTATAIGDEAKDACSTFTITSGGVQTATGSDPSPSTDCWK
jgi:type IV pilus assembly protein PilE